MTKHSPFAREHIMQEYLDSLLHAPADEAEAALRASQLLEKASQQLTQEASHTAIADVLDEKTAVVTEHVDIAEKGNTESEVQHDAEQRLQLDDNKAKIVPVQSILEERFQALLFDVAGLTLAVPLVTLGGIHQIEKVGPLFGKPAWFMGVMLHRDEKLSVVDTAQWVMPEKYDQTLAERLNYRYLIMLGDSEWGLACESLVTTETLNKSDVKWRESQGKRPWLAGMVKEKMCALIDVNQLVLMLNNGLGSNDQTP